MRAAAASGVSFPVVRQCGLALKKRFRIRWQLNSNWQTLLPNKQLITGLTSGAQFSQRATPEPWNQNSLGKGTQGEQELEGGEAKKAEKKQAGKHSTESILMYNPYVPPFPLLPSLSWLFN
jgi:hypothetical protein